MDDVFTKRLNDAKRLKMYRKLIGMKAYEMAEILGVDQPEYSKKENGYSNIREDQIQKARDLFIAWRVKEIDRLNGQIQYLKEIL